MRSTTSGELGLALSCAALSELGTGQSPLTREPNPRLADGCHIFLTLHAHQGAVHIEVEAVLFQLLCPARACAGLPSEPTPQHLALLRLALCDCLPRPPLPSRVQHVRMMHGGACSSFHAQRIGWPSGSGLAAMLSCSSGRGQQPLVGDLRC